MVKAYKALGAILPARGSQILDQASAVLGDLLWVHLSVGPQLLVYLAVAEDVLRLPGQKAQELVGQLTQMDLLLTDRYAAWHFEHERKLAKIIYLKCVCRHAWEPPSPAR